MAKMFDQVFHDEVLLANELYGDWLETAAFHIGQRVENSNGDKGTILDVPEQHDSLFLVRFDDDDENCYSYTVIPSHRMSRDYRPLTTLCIGQRGEDEEGDKVTIIDGPTPDNDAWTVRYDDNSFNDRSIPDNLMPRRFFPAEENPAAEEPTAPVEKDYPHICPVCQAPAYKSCITGKVDCSSSVCGIEHDVEKAAKYFESKISDKIYSSLVYGADHCIINSDDSAIRDVKIIGKWKI